MGIIFYHCRILMGAILFNFFQDRFSMSKLEKSILIIPD
jgi:hypothetical protein